MDNITNACIPESGWTSTKLMLFLAANSIKAFISLFSVSASLLLFFATSKTKPLHLNVRILICSLALSCAIACVSYLISGLHTVLGYLAAGGTQGWCIWWGYCQGQLGLQALAGITLVIMPIMIGVERLVATLQHMSYELRSSKLGVSLAGLTWFFGMLVFVAGLFRRPPGPMYRSYCMTAVYERSSKASVSLERNLVTFVGFTSVQGISLILYTVVYKKANSILKAYGANTARLSLSSRLELRHSIWITRTVLPAVAVIAAGVIISMLFGMLMGQWASELDHDTSMVLTQFMVYCVMGMSIFGAAVISLMKNDLLYKEAKVILRKFVCCVAFENAVEPEQGRNYQLKHFQQLNNMWA